VACYTCNKTDTQGLHSLINLYKYFSFYKQFFSIHLLITGQENLEQVTTMNTILKPWPFQPLGDFITPDGPPSDGDSGKGTPW